MVIFNFIFVYSIAGFILGNVFIGISKKNLNTTLAYLFGYGIAPLLISLMLYYLYWFWPHQEWFFYAIVIYSFWAMVLAMSIYYKTISDIKKNRLLLRNFFSAVQKLTITSKLLLVFIVFTVGFIFIRGQLYPNLWADAIYYYQQGHVYSVDHSLDRLTTQIPFLEDGSGYVMNPSIRPAIPILYSFFYTTPTSQNIFIFSGSFLYFYYFILLLGIFSYILKKFHFDYERVLIGLTLLLSSYYLSNFLIFGFKEIILMFFLLTGLFIGYATTENTAGGTVLRPALFGILLGLSFFINLSGVIIGGIIGIIYLVELFVHKVKFKKVILHIIVVSIFSVLFSGAELKYSFDFIFKRPLLNESSVRVTETSEYVSYKIVQQENPVSDTTAEPDTSQVTTTAEPDTNSITIDEELDPIQIIADSGLKKQILLKGKLQAFTQLQFYGIIFLLFVAILIIRILQKRKLVHFEKNILGFFWLFFFIVMDPFFLNIHAQAYVLSISPKYTILLIPLAVLFVTMNYDVILNMFAKINIKYLLLSSLFILLILPGIRSLVVPNTLRLFEIFMPLYNSREYYMDKFDLLYFGIGILFFVINVLFCYLIIVKATPGKKIAAINLLFITGGFVFLFLFLLNNNYNIADTFQNISATKEAQLEMVETNTDALAYVKTINYLNRETDHQTKILLLYYRPSIYYIKDYHRFVVNPFINQTDTSTKQLVDVQDASYIVVRKTDLKQYDFYSIPMEVEQDFDSVVLLRVLR